VLEDNQCQTFTVSHRSASSIQSTIAPSVGHRPCHGARAEERRRVASKRCCRLHIVSPGAGLNTERTPPPPHSRSLSSPSLSLWSGSPRRKTEAQLPPQPSPCSRELTVSPPSSKSRSLLHQHPLHLLHPLLDPIV
jgi:hypothetical protein